MSEQRWLRRSEGWTRLLLRLYPSHFREEMGEEVVEAYRDRSRTALRRGGLASLAVVWLRALIDSLHNGLGERMRPSIAWWRMGNWGRDMQFLTRRLARAPVFVLATVGTLTVGLGAFAVVFAVVHNVLLAPLPYEDPEGLHFVWRDYGPIFELDRGWLGGTDVAEMQKSDGVIVDAAALQRGRATLTSSDDTDPSEIAVMATTPNLFSLLGVRPALGRGFAPNEGGPGRPPVMVLTHDLWTRLGADPGILGTDLRVNGEPYTVLGVLPEEFAFMRHSSLGPPQGADAYTTLDVDLAETNPGAGSYAGLIRAREGTPPERVAAEVAAIGETIDRRDFEDQGLKLYPVGMKEDLVAGMRPALIVLGLAGVFLFVVLMVNLATLLLARAGEREREFAISRALGANPLALARAMLLEGGALGLLGGVTGTLAAFWATRALVALAPLDMPRREAIAVDWTVALVVIGASALMGLIAAAGPAASAASSSLAAVLRNAAVRGGGGHGGLRRAMVVAQVALSLVLLSAGALVVRSFERLLRADPGFAAENVLSMRVPIPTAVFPGDENAAAIQQRLEAELAAIPGVSAVGATAALPLSANANQTTIEIPGAPGNTGDEEHDQPLIDWIGIRAGYTDAIGMRVLAGRGLDPARREGVREALIDDVLAHHFFPTGNPLGARIPFGDDTLAVVGVVEQAHLYDVHQEGRGQLYVRAEDFGFRNLWYAVRSTRDPSSLTRDVRSAIDRVDPQLALSEVRTMESIVGDALRQQRATAVLIAGFSLGALLLAAMGLFGVVAAAVNRRRHELAVRMALGSTRGQALRLVVAEGMSLVLLGLLVGVPGVYVSARVISAVLVGISPFDPMTLGAVATGLGLVALLACYAPARRVLGIEPASLLRQD